jgi:chaperonin GroES
MKLKPLFDRIIVERKSAEEKTLGGIILPDTAKEKPVEGTVLAIGKDVKDLAVGDKILFAKFGGTEVKLDGKIYLIMKEIDVLGVIE